MAKKLEKFLPKAAVTEKLRKYAKSLEIESKSCENEQRRKTAQDKLAAVNTVFDMVLCMKTAVFDSATVEYWTQKEQGQT